MATSTILYQGNLRTQATHLSSGQSIITDAPLDNQGKGEAFSPTDLVATALGSCMLTIMGIKANALQLNIEGTRISITKVMQANPRRISKVIVGFEVVSSTPLTQEQKQALENAAHTCPVALSLHPEIVQEISFNYL